MSEEVMEKLESQGKQILSGLGDVTLVNEEVNQIWDLEITELTKPLRAVIVQHLRNNRKLFNQVRKAKSTRKAKVPVPDGGINLDDLDLDLKL